MHMRSAAHRGDASGSRGEPRRRNRIFDEVTTCPVLAFRNACGTPA